MFIKMTKTDYWTTGVWWRDGCVERHKFRQMVFVGPQDEWIYFDPKVWTKDTLTYMAKFFLEADIKCRQLIAHCDRSGLERGSPGWWDVYKKGQSTGRTRVTIPDGSLVRVGIPVAASAAAAAATAAAGDQVLVAGVDFYQGEAGNADCVVNSVGTGCKLLEIDTAPVDALLAAGGQLRLKETGQFIIDASAGKYTTYPLKDFYHMAEIDRLRKGLKDFILSKLSSGKMLVKIAQFGGYDKHVLLIDCDSRLIYDGDPAFGSSPHPLTQETLTLMGISGFKDARLFGLQAR